MLQSGPKVETPDGTGRIVSLVNHGGHIVTSIDEDRIRIRAVLLDSGEVRWYVDSTLRPLTWAPVA